MASLQEALIWLVRKQTQPYNYLSSKLLRFCYRVSPRFSVSLIMLNVVRRPSTVTIITWLTSALQSSLPPGTTGRNGQRAMHCGTGTLTLKKHQLRLRCSLGFPSGKAHHRHQLRQRCATEALNGHRLTYLIHLVLCGSDRSLKERPCDITTLWLCS